MTRHLRIAWTGEAGDAGAGGVAGIAYQLLAGLAHRGHEIDVFVASADDAVAPGLLRLPENVDLVRQPSWWRWGRWYSRGHLAAFASSSAARIQTQRRLADSVLRRHRERPYDVIFQMSQFESFFRGRPADDPPLVVHPCTIARLESEWHRAERRLAMRTEHPARVLVVGAMLAMRSLLQRRHVRHPQLLVGPSRRFLGDLHRAYGVPADRLALLRHPVDLERFAPGADATPSEPRRLLFVSRMSSRKGLELVVQLSHRLDDLAGEVEIALIGGATLWSDYSGLLDELNPNVARYEGQLPSDEVRERLRSAEALLVPSRFEPGSIVTGEALASGLPVIASSAVGPSEIIDPSAGRVFSDGDAAAFEHATRSLLAELGTARTTVRAAARATAVAELDPDRIVGELEDHLRAAVSRGARPRRDGQGSGGRTRAS